MGIRNGRLLPGNNGDLVDVLDIEILGLEPRGDVDLFRCNTPEEVGSGERTGYL